MTMQPIVDMIRARDAYGIAKHVIDGVYDGASAPDDDDEDDSVYRRRRLARGIRGWIESRGGNRDEAYADMVDTYTDLSIDADVEQVELDSDTRSRVIEQVGGRCEAALASASDTDEAPDSAITDLDVQPAGAMYVAIGASTACVCGSARAASAVDAARAICVGDGSDAAELLKLTERDPDSREVIDGTSRFQMGGFWLYVVPDEHAEAAPGWAPDDYGSVIDACGAPAAFVEARLAADA